MSDNPSDLDRFSAAFELRKQDLADQLGEKIVRGIAMLFSRYATLLLSLEDGNVIDEASCNAYLTNQKVEVGGARLTLWLHSPACEVDGNYSAASLRAQLVLMEENVEGQELVYDGETFEITLVVPYGGNVTFEGPPRLMYPDQPEES